MKLAENIANRIAKQYKGKIKAASILKLIEEEIENAPKTWCVVDHASNDQRIRGPYRFAETAGVVRAELEQAWYEDEDDRDDDEAYHPNYWIVEESSNA